MFYYVDWAHVFAAGIAIFVIGLFKGIAQSIREYKKKEDD